MIKKGIFPTMVTPYDDKGNIDYDSLDRFMDKLRDDGADGLFAVCQSSEMFFLSPDEKVELSAYVKRKSGIQVIASGHTQNTYVKQLEAMKKIADTGVDAVVLISNAFASPDEDDDIFIKNLDKFLTGFKREIPLGIYECPYPYKRLLTEKTLKYVLDTGRFVFLKDTSCDIDTMNKRLDIIENYDFGLYNANAESLAATILKGAAGFCGIHANITIKLIRCLMEYPLASEGIGKKAQDLIMDFADYFRVSNYPVSAKVMLKDMGVFNTIYSRAAGPAGITTEIISDGREILRRIREFENEYDSIA